jgi:hypothetical protein
MNYGELINDFNYDRDFLYKKFGDYFNNPVMYKIKDIGKFSMYMSKVKCLLNNLNRYIIIFTLKDYNSIMYTENLKNLKWENIQTRSLNDEHNIPAHEYNPTRNTDLYVPITRTKKNTDTSVYSCGNFTLEILLLHDKGDTNQYQDNGNLVSAIETYKTIINIID